MENKNLINIESVIDNIRKIMRDRNLTQAAIAEYADTTPSQFSKILNGSVQLSLIQLSNIATKLNLRIIDIFTYPDKYVKQNQKDDSNIHTTLTIDIRNEKRDEILKILFGNENLKLLNND